MIEITPLRIDTENPQMMCYALGALELFDDIYDIDTVSMTIFQPRRDNVSTYDISKEELYRWADEVLKPAAELAFAGDGNFLCGEWCGFCKAKHDCRARAEANMELAKYDFKLPPLLTDEEIEDVLTRVDDLVSWASDIKEYALQQAISGKAWPGWKLVEGRSNRKYTNEAAVAATVTNAGFDPYEKKLLGVTAMQKLLGKSRFEELLSSLIRHTGQYLRIRVRFQHCLHGRGILAGLPEIKLRICKRCQKIAAWQFIKAVLVCL